MNTRNNGGKLTATVLSISLLTVMAGAAIAPALGIIRDHFSDAPDMLVQFIVSLPALLIIVTNLLFPWLCSLLKTRSLALTGLLLYVVAGAGCFFVDNIWLLLTMRALLGVSVGMIMPLSTGLLAYYFPSERQASLMGLSAAMNQMGGVVATLLAGLLANIEWNYAFLVYLLSAALYLGQFLSPLVVTPLGALCFGADDLLAPFKAGVIIGAVYLLQAFLTRKKQVVE